jgi:hypothetical protein
VRVKFWTNRICRPFGGVHLGIRYHFPHVVLDDSKDMAPCRNYQFDFGLIGWEISVAILVKIKTPIQTPTL